MLNGGGGYFNSSIWSSAALLSKDAIAGTAFSFLVLVKGLLLTLYPQMIERIRKDDVYSRNATDDIMSTYETMAFIGLISALLLFLMDCKGSKILWDSSARRVRIPRYSFAIIDISDRRDMEYDILGRGDPGNIGISGGGGDPALLGYSAGSGGRLDNYSEDAQSRIEDKYKPVMEMIEEKETPVKSEK